MPTNPKLDQFVQSHIQKKDGARSSARHGIVMSYNRTSNTATVMMSSVDNDVPSEILKNVPCPVIMGIQTVAPEPGRPCWVSFKTDNGTFPVITHYFNHSFEKFDHDRHYKADTGLPNFMLNL